MYIHILLMYYTRVESAWYSAEEEINGYHLVVHLLIFYLTYHQHSALTTAIETTTTIDRRTVWHREFLRFVSFASESAFFHDHLTLIPVKNECFIRRSRMKREEI